MATTMEEKAWLEAARALELWRRGWYTGRSDP